MRSSRFATFVTLAFLTVAPTADARQSPDGATAVVSGRVGSVRATTLPDGSPTVALGIVYGRQAMPVFCFNALRATCGALRTGQRVQINAVLLFVNEGRGAPEVIIAATRVTVR